MESKESRNEHGDPGIVLDRETDPGSGNGELVWYARIEPDEATQVGCPFPWLGGNNKLSIILTRAAPVISIQTSKPIIAVNDSLSVSPINNK